MNDNIEKLINDLGENYKNCDLLVLKDLYAEISSIASNITNRPVTDEKLYPYIKTAVKSSYLIRGGEGLNSISDGGKNLTFDNIIEKMKNDLTKAGLRLLF